MGILPDALNHVKKKKLYGERKIVSNGYIAASFVEL